jgi:hypothetical protein
MKKIKNINSDRTNLPLLVIPVSSRIIAEAVKADSHHCMIADGIKKRIPKAQFISVDLQSIRFTDPDTKIRYQYFTPLTGQQNLVKFDQGKSIKPFTITLKDGIKIPAGLNKKRSKIKFGTGNKRAVPLRKKIYAK